MLYGTCPTCKKILGDKQIKYEIELEKINNNSNLTLEQKEEKKQELAKSFVSRYCCRMRLITYVDFSNILV